jgi:PAS domain S-box-containing protein
VGGASLAAYSQRALHEALSGWLAQVGERECDEIKGAAASALAERDENRLIPLLRGLLESTDGAYAAALDPTGRIVAHSDVAQAGRMRGDALTREALASSRPIARELVRDGRELVEVLVPVFSDPSREDEFLLSQGPDAGGGERRGLLVLGIPTDDERALERRIGAVLLRGTLLLGGAACLLLLALMRRLLAPIRALSDGVRRVGEGDYAARIPGGAADEFGELARSFNRMTADLARTTVSRQFFNDILDGLQEIVIVTGAEGKVSHVNPAACAALGRSAAELVGTPAQALLADGDVPFESGARNAAARLRPAAGESLPVLFSSSAIKDAEGRVTGWVGAARDVRDVRQLEARMRQSEKLSAVGQLAAGVAHEINNPLGVILGFAQGMSRQLAPGDDYELPVRSIEREALRCKSLVQSLLTFARTSQPDRGPLAVNPAVEQALALLLPQARMAGVAVKAELAEGLPPVLGNKNQLEQVVLNLAKNAIDAMPGGGTLTLSTELCGAAPHSWVCLRFVDDGGGIPADVLPRIFDPFFTTKPVGQGTGLGLSLVNEIVQKHSGELSVESRPGRTAFTVKLPARTGAEATRA